MGHAQIIKDQASIADELAHFLCDTAHLFGFDNADSEASQAGDVFWAKARADAAAVLIIVPVEDIVAAVFNAPVVAVDFQQFLRIGLFRGPTGNAVGDVTGVVSGFFIDGLALDDKGLLHMRKVQVAVEFGGDPDGTDFDAAVIG